MNRTIRAAFAGVAVLLVSLTGCTDPSVSPTSTPTEDNIFKDPNSYLAFLAKIYAGLAVTGQKGPACPGDQPLCKDIFSINDEGFSQYMRLYWEHEELPTDEAVLAWNDGPVQEFNGQTWGSTNSFVSAMFARVFLQVSYVNEFLEQTSAAKLTERGVPAVLRDKIQQYRAEARFMRALSYWHGLDLFGPIPVVTVNDPTPPKPSTRQEVYDFIVSELLAVRDGPGLEVLPATAGASTYGRATKEAASMLLAKVYLNAGVYTGTPHWADAQIAAQAVISGPFSLDPNFRHPFMADNNTSPEIIFPVAQDGQHTQSYGGTTFLIHASCGNSMVPGDYGVDGCWYGLRLKPEAYNRSAADPRGSYFYTTGQTVAINNLTNFGDGIPGPKFTNLKSTGGQGSSSAFPDTDFPLFRLADAYLIYAEAVLRNNGSPADSAQALAYVNAIRERAYGNTSADITLAQLNLQFILDERGRELLWEAHRRTDLVRFGQFTGGTYIWSWKGNVQAGQATDSHLDLYPFPASQLSANPSLVQNPGY